MKLEQQVTSLELSKRLKELGVKQESEFYWLRHSKIDERLMRSPNGERETTHPREYAAFTVAELGEMLPSHLHIRELRPDFLLIKQNENAWVVGYSDYEREGTPPIREKSEADARAKMLVYLLENKLIPTI